MNRRSLRDRLLFGGGLLLLLAACGSNAPQVQTPPTVTSASPHLTSPVVYGFSYPQFQTPIVTGSTTVGSTLSTTNGTWRNSPTLFIYQWQRCTGTCVSIQGANSSTYTLVSADAGDTINVVVTAANRNGTATATSNPVGPIVGTGFPDASNTGYLNAPLCPNGLTGTISGPWTPTANTTYSCTLFNGVGPDITVTGVTFYGDKFVDNNIADAELKVDAGTTTFSYDTFAASSGPPVTYGQGNQYNINDRCTCTVLIDHTDFWGFGEAIQFSGSSQANPLHVSESYFHDPSADGGGAYHTDGILSNNGGPDYMVFNHNTIIIPGTFNTNDLALQSTVPGGTPYDHVTISNNYFSGDNIMVDVGTQTTTSSFISFTGNTWASDYEPANGPLYSTAPFTVANNGTWSGNKMKVVGGTTWLAAGNDGLFWWPTDGNPANNTQIIGHASDYTEP